MVGSPGDPILRAPAVLIKAVKKRKEKKTFLPHTQLVSGVWCIWRHNEGALWEKRSVKTSISWASNTGSMCQTPRRLSMWMIGMRLKIALSWFTLVWLFKWAFPIKYFKASFDIQTLLTSLQNKIPLWTQTQAQRWTCFNCTAVEMYFSSNFSFSLLSSHGSMCLKSWLTSL